jgi:hypothetical protein
LCQRARKPFVFDCHVVKLTVRFDMAQARPLRGCDGSQGANLYHHHVVGFLVGDSHIATAKALNVWQTWMGTEGHALFERGGHGFTHCGGIPAMKTTGDVCG